MLDIVGIYFFLWLSCPQTGLAVGGWKKKDMNIYMRKGGEDKEGYWKHDTVNSLEGI